MRKIRRLMILLMIIIMLVPSTLAYAAQDGVHSSYTYNYDYWGEIRESPDAYHVAAVLDSTSLGL